MLLTVHRNSTVFLVICDVALLAIAIGGFYRWKGPHADTTMPEALSRYRRGTLLSALLAALVLVGLLAHG